MEKLHTHETYRETTNTKFYNESLNVKLKEDVVEAEGKYHG